MSDKPPTPEEFYRHLGDSARRHGAQMRDQRPRVSDGLRILLVGICLGAIGTAIWCLIGHTIIVWLSAVAPNRYV